MDPAKTPPVAKPRATFLSRALGPLGSILLHGGVLLAAVLISTGFAASRIHSSGAEGVSGVFSVGVRGRELEAELPPKVDAPNPRVERIVDDEIVDSSETSPLPSELPDTNDGPLRRPPAPLPEVSYEPLLPDSGDGRKVKFPMTGSGAGSKGDGPGDGKATEVYNPPPAYPLKARRQHIEGNVLVEVKVAENGRCDTATVVESSGSALLDDAALAAVRKWEFSPAKKGGQAVASVERIRFEFRLDDKKK